MRIVVCIKQIPDTNKVRINPETGTLIREGVPAIINTHDRNALEAGLTIREQAGGEVIVITMGPPQAGEALREALALGADRAILLSDRSFAGADTFATANTLEAAIAGLQPVDLVICGQQASDGDTAQVGPQLAERLGYPQATNVVSILPCGEWSRIAVTRETENGLQQLEMAIPALLAVNRNVNKPRYPTIRGITQLKNMAVEQCSAADLGVDTEKLGLSGSRTQVVKTFTPVVDKKGVIMDWEGPETISRLSKMLKERQVL